ncbi:hypothetical protein BJY24_007528 [Nocardia transvalensis]|uniref:Uncharacterized protein n=1 Tax=Nocardia transvalensis TaxID=37333 RepID=A0A7W9UMG9_9NOCA|nr:hypothetical protein [Nocardia transvalensis]MBB5918616.1 hypothetical protein [Nocardia transvalensis]
MEPVSCRTCGCRVLVEKYSPQHTSVQWSRAARSACTRLPDASEREHTCPALRAAIDAAVEAGELCVSTREQDVMTRGQTLART